MAAAPSTLHVSLHADQQFVAEPCGNLVRRTHQTEVAPLLEMRSCRAQGCGDGAGRDANQHGDVRLLEVKYVAQRNRNTFPLREMADRSPNLWGKLRRPNRRSSQRAAVPAGSGHLRRLRLIATRYGQADGSSIAAHRSQAMAVASEARSSASACPPTTGNIACHEPEQASTYRPYNRSETDPRLTNRSQ